MQNNRLMTNNKGVTLVELIAVIAVLGIVIAAVTGFMITGAQMSSKVGNTATASIKEQTAVEFINERIWEADSELVSLENGDGINSCEKLVIGDAAIFTNRQNDIAWVQYQYGTNAVINLCPGEILFEYDVVSKTVTYTLNDVVHVVHLRVNRAGDGGNT